MDRLGRQVRATEPKNEGVALCTPLYPLYLRHSDTNFPLRDDRFTHEHGPASSGRPGDVSALVRRVKMDKDRVLYGVRRTPPPPFDPFETAGSYELRRIPAPPSRGLDNHNESTLHPTEAPVVRSLFEESDMEGIRYVTDEEGRKVAVQIDLDRYGEFWEDFFDALILEQRKGEESLPFEEVEKRLIAEGKLSRG